MAQYYIGLAYEYGSYGFELNFKKLLNGIIKQLRRVMRMQLRERMRCGMRIKVYGLVRAFVFVCLSNGILIYSS